MTLLRALGLGTTVVCGACSASSGAEESTLASQQADTTGDIIGAVASAAALIELDANPSFWAVLGAVAGLSAAGVNVYGDLTASNPDVGALAAEIAAMKSEMGAIEDAIADLNRRLAADVVALDLQDVQLAQADIQAAAHTLADLLAPDPALGHPLDPTSPVYATLDSEKNHLEADIMLLEAWIAHPPPDSSQGALAVKMFVYALGLKIRLAYEVAGLPMSTDWLLARYTALKAMRYPVADATYTALEALKLQLLSVLDQHVEPYQPVAGAADFTGDGVPDLVLHDPFTKLVSVYPVGRDMKYGSPTTLDTIDPAQWRLRAIADASGDGSPDLVWQDVTPRSISHAVRVWSMHGLARAGDWDATSSLPPVRAAGSFAANGRAELAFGAGASAGLFSDATQGLWWGDAQSSASASVNLGVFPDWTWHVRAAGDVNKDGRADVLWYHKESADRTLRVWQLGAATGSPIPNAPVTEVDLTWRGTSVNGPRALADFDGDGNADLLDQSDSGVLSVWFLKGAVVDHRAVLSNRNAPREVLWRNTGTNAIGTWRLGPDATVAAYTYPWTLPAGASVAAFADFDANGESDVLYRAPNGDVGLVPLAGGVPLDNNRPSVPVGTAPMVWTIAGAGDFNGDAFADILWRNTQTGEIAIWNLADGFAASGYVTTTLPLDWVVQGVGDFDGDRRADVLLRRASTGDVGLLVAVAAPAKQFGQSNASFAPLVVARSAVDLGWSVQGVGDLDADGRADIVWRNARTNEVAAWLMHGAAISDWAMSFHYGIDPGLVISGVGDLNGDGRADVLFRKGPDVSAWLMNGGGGWGAWPVRGGVESFWQIAGVGGSAR